MTRTVKGPTDHVVVVGAGLGGLSAALRLAGAGRKVEQDGAVKVAAVCFIPRPYSPRSQRGIMGILLVVSQDHLLRGVHAGWFRMAEMISNATWGTMAFPSPLSRCVRLGIPSTTRPTAGSTDHLCSTPP